jgi:DinB superfamily
MKGITKSTCEARKQPPPLAETALGRCRSRAVPPSAAISTKNEAKMKRTVVILALLVLAPLLRAQAVPAETQNPVSAALREILPGRQKNTVAAIEAMPADKFNYKPSGDQRTFGQLVDHMVETNYLLCGKAAAVPSRTVEGTKDTDSKDKQVTALKASFDFCSEALAKMDDSKLTETTEGFGGKQVTRAWISLVLAGTWADHYAEAAMYLRLNGVLPPTAKK